MSEEISPEALLFFSEKPQALPLYLAFDTRITAEPLLNFVPETFTIHQLREERLRQGQTSDVRMLLSRWCKKGKILRIEKGVYRKLMKTE